MTIHRLLARACIQSTSAATTRSPHIVKTFATKAPPPFPTTPTCPAPTCSCAPSPELPEGLEIDRSASLSGLISNYAQHVLVCTGKSDWPSRIEEDNAGDNLVADLRELVGPRGKYNDPFHNISTLASSFPSSPAPRQRPELQTSSVYLLPQFKYVPFLPRVSFDSVEALVRGYLQPETLHPMHDGLSPIHRDRLLRKPAYQNLLWGVRDVREVMVLICGHGGRDRRCGIYGPLLRGEFEKRLPEQGVEVLRGPVDVEAEVEGQAVVEGQGSGRAHAARVGLISHIGGHKYAGNVIVYLPPTLKTEDGQTHPLAGHGIWYGRVEPAHVEGIVSETILKGRVIEELFRGGIRQDGQILRL
ncbi:Sucrase/ferredoxin-like-domain-containing protein [Corynascus similis CBS 632.67]